MFYKNIWQKENIQIFLLLLLPFLLITGPLLSDFVVSIIAIIFFFKLNIIFKDQSLKKVFVFFLIFYIYLNLNSILSSYTDPNLNSFFYFRLFLFAFAVNFLITKPELFFKYLFIIVAFIYLLLLFDGLSEFIFNKNILNYDNQYQNRVSSLFGDELVLGSYTVRILPVLLGSILFFYKEKKIGIYFFSIFYFVALVIIFISGERTSVLLFSVFTLFIFFFWSNKIKLKIITIFVLAIIILFLGSEKLRQRFIIEPMIQMNFVSQKDLQKKK